MAIEISIGRPIAVTDDETARGPYWDVPVVINGHPGVLSIESSGRPLAGSVDLAGWTSKSLRPVAPCDIEEARFMAAALVALL